MRARVRAFWIGPSSTREINYLCHVRKPKKANCVWFECVPLSISLAKFGCTTAPVCSGPSKCKIRSTILSIDRPKKHIRGFVASASSNCSSCTFMGGPTLGATNEPTRRWFVSIEPWCRWNGKSCLLASVGLGCFGSNTAAPANQLRHLAQAEVSF